MLTDYAIEKIEKKYFDILSELLERSIGQIITQVYSQSHIRGAAIGGTTNPIEDAVENVIEALIAKQLDWNVCSMTVSADSCFECGDAIIHIDAKTIAETDGDSIYKKINVESSQTTYAKGNPITVAGKTWEPKLNLYENHELFGEIPNLTYIIKIIYSEEHLVKEIKIVSLPHGQLHEAFGNERILNAGRSGSGDRRSNIRFKEDEISNINAWRIKSIYLRKDVEDL